MANTIQPPSIGPTEVEYTMALSKLETKKKSLCFLHRRSLTCAAAAA